MNDASDHDPRFSKVLDFWFGMPGEADYLQTRKQWFEKDAAFDARIAEHFGPLIDGALRDQLRAWSTTPNGAVAQIIVLDQFTRNTRRGTADMFSGDALALAAAKALCRDGGERGLPGVFRQFVYLPFEHSEDIADQHESMRLFAQLGNDEPALSGLSTWAQGHLDIVARFGRFPHRNALLGRDSTPEEIKFLEQPGSGF
ncbi:MAG: DUF924 family protein [Rubrivivax sp.]